jgi:hypothetical protein
MESPVASAIWRMPARFHARFSGCTEFSISVRFVGVLSAKATVSIF